MIAHILKELLLFLAKECAISEALLGNRLTISQGTRETKDLLLQTTEKEVFCERFCSPHHLSPMPPSFALASFGGQGSRNSHLSPIIIGPGCGIADGGPFPASD